MIYDLSGVMWGSCICYVRHITSSLPLNLGKNKKTCNLPKMFNAASVSMIKKKKTKDFSEYSGCLWTGFQITKEGTVYLVS